MLSVCPSIRMRYLRCASRDTILPKAGCELDLISAEPLSKKPISRKLTTKPSGTVRSATSRREISGANACCNSCHKEARLPSSSTLEGEPLDAVTIRPRAAIRLAFSTACTVLNGMGSFISAGTCVFEAENTPNSWNATWIASARCPTFLLSTWAVE